MPDHAPFVHLRVRSPVFACWKGRSGSRKPRRCARRFGMPAAALTDTNNLFGALEFSEVLSGEGVQPITGCTLVGARRARRARGARRADGTLVLLAQSEAGYANLMKLSSAAYLDVAATERAPCADQKRCWSIATG
jgi:DNA polymerase-3 subunit alpha